MAILARRIWEEGRDDHWAGGGSGSGNAMDACGRHLSFDLIGPWLMQPQSQVKAPTCVACLHA